MTRVEIIAEIGWNFMGDMGLANSMIAEAARRGADFAKFQYWREENLKPGLWDHDGRRDIYIKAQLDLKKINQLIAMCRDNEIKPLFSCFGLSEAKELSEIDPSVVKIPSHEMYNLELLEYVTKNFSRVIASTGATYKSELDRSINKLREADTAIDLMHCVSAYPCDFGLQNLGKIAWLRNRYELPVGYSDHSRSLVSGAFAVAMGATLLEKHFSLSNALPGRDNQFALEPNQLERYISNVREAEASLIWHGDEPLTQEYEIIQNYRGRWSRC